MSKAFRKFQSKKDAKASLKKWQELPEIDVYGSAKLNSKGYDIYEAIRNKSTIEIRYDKEPILRKINPIRVFGKDKSIYVAGYCFKSRNERFFRLDRIDSVAVCDPMPIPAIIEKPKIQSPSRSGCCITFFSVISASFYYLFKSILLLFS